MALPEIVLLVVDIPLRAIVDWTRVDIPSNVDTQGHTVRRYDQLT
jgi:hypothetical protein